MDTSISEILKKVRQVEIRTNRLSGGAFAGAYHSAFKGQGIDFAEVREYQHGDDVRAIDWNVTAKMDRPFIKVFHEERELTLMLLVDISASGWFGSSSKTKRELIAEISSVLAYSATRNNDKVGLLLFTDQIEHFVPPKKGRQHILRIIRDLLFFKPKSKGTDIAAALEYFNRMQKRQAITFLLSDFMLPSEQEKHFQKWLSISKVHHDLICMHVHDPRESTLPDIGNITLEDAETGEQIALNTRSQKARLAYARENIKRMENRRRQFQKLGIATLQFSTEKPYINILRKFFETRTRKRK